MMQVKVKTPTFPPLGRTRSSRFRPSLPTRRRRRPPWQLVGAAALPLAALAAFAFVARRRFFQGVALFAKAVEEVADAIEDAAEDLGDAAKARADRGEASE
jgi:hypothetical protein